MSSAAATQKQPGKWWKRMANGNGHLQTWVVRVTAALTVFLVIAAVRFGVWMIRTSDNRYTDAQADLDWNAHEAVHARTIPPPEVRCSIWCVKPDGRGGPSCFPHTCSLKSKTPVIEW